MFSIFYLDNSSQIQKNFRTIKIKSLVYLRQYFYQMITKIQHRWTFFQTLLYVALTFFPGFSNNFLTIFPVSTDTSFLLSSSPKLMPPILGFSYGNALPLHQLLHQFSIATIMLHNKSSPKSGINQRALIYLMRLCFSIQAGWLFWL